jgi:AraC family transcriptional regulator
VSHRLEIERALRFIVEHLDEPLTVSEVARAAHLSEFHFHRLFHAEVGEPIGRFVTRQRLAAAALRLAYERDRPITDVALSSGYSSTSNFAKAFKAYFGASPTDVREGRDLPAAVSKLTREHGKHFRPSDLYVVPPALGDDERRALAAACVVRMEESTGLDFACVSGPGGYGLDALGPLWASHLEHCRQLGICGDDVDTWGLAFDSPAVTSPELCRYHACIPCSAEQRLPAPLFRGRLPEGRYAVFTWRGAVEQLEASYRTIFSCWFPLSALAPDDYTPYQRYVNDEPRDGQVELETWFKVRPRG